MVMIQNVFTFLKNLRPWVMVWGVVAHMLHASNTRISGYNLLPRFPFGLGTQAVSHPTPKLPPLQVRARKK
jgi:hypothetical protein